jgi:hypothetical protein
MQTRLQLTFSGSNPSALAERALASGFLPGSPPSSTEVGRTRVAPAGSLSALAGASSELVVTWGDDALLQLTRRNDRLYVDRTRWDVTAAGTMALLRDWPFEVCIMSSLEPAWWKGYRSLHGWGFLLKGHGHRLVSSHVIERGPWRLLRDEERDTTLFQFHDLGADEATALAQARPGHALLEPVWQGGHYASQVWLFRGGATGYKPSYYDRSTRTSIIMVRDREVSPAEMGIAAGTRVHQIFPVPIDQVAFVYTDEETAQRQLPALWMYGLEVRAMTALGERRLDLDYEPPRAALPDWVKRS